MHEYVAEHPRRTLCQCMRTFSFEKVTGTVRNFSRGEEQNLVDWPTWHIVSAHRRRERKFSSIFRHFRLNLKVNNACVEGASEKFWAFCTEAKYYITIYKFQKRKTAIGPPPDAHEQGFNMKYFNSSNWAVVYDISGNTIFERTRSLALTSFLSSRRARYFVLFSWTMTSGGLRSSGDDCGGRKWMTGAVDGMCRAQGCLRSNNQRPPRNPGCVVSHNEKTPVHARINRRSSCTNALSHIQIISK